jgi:hypothetical protein
MLAIIEGGAGTLIPFQDAQDSVRLFNDASACAPPRTVQLSIRNREGSSKAFLLLRRSPCPGDRHILRMFILHGCSFEGETLH